jgi:hypothetical protein
MKLKLKDTVAAIRYDGENGEAIKEFCESKEFCQFEIWYIGIDNNEDYHMPSKEPEESLVLQMALVGDPHVVNVGDIFWTWDGKNVECVKEQDMWELAFEVEDGYERKTKPCTSCALEFNCAEDINGSKCDQFKKKGN